MFDDEHTIVQSKTEMKMKPCQYSTALYTPSSSTALDHFCVFLKSTMIAVNDINITPDHASTHIINTPLLKKHHSVNDIVDYTTKMIRKQKACIKRTHLNNNNSNFKTEIQKTPKSRWENGSNCFNALKKNNIINYQKTLITRTRSLSWAEKNVVIDHDDDEIRFHKVQHDQHRNTNRLLLTAENTQDIFASKTSFKISSYINNSVKANQMTMSHHNDRLPRLPKRS